MVLRASGAATEARKRLGDVGLDDVERPPIAGQARETGQIILLHREVGLPLGQASLSSVPGLGIRARRDSSWATPPS